MLEVKNLTKKYKARNSETVYALNNVSLNLGDKGMVFLLGKSGSGKSTLLNVMGGLDSFDSGEIIINGKSSRDFKEKDFDAYRNTYLGFIFQEYNILNEFTVAKNIAIALELQGKKSTNAAVDMLLEQVDLAGMGNRKPNQLSGGQKQRIAIARALIKNPDIIMADEPTGALDSKTGQQVFQTLKKLSKEKLVIVVSHDRENAEMFADRIIELRDGLIISDTTKHYKEPNKIAGNINVINNEMLQVKNAQNLNLDAWNMIGCKLKSRADEIMIVSNKDLNHQIKKIAKISDEGNFEVFEQTKESDVQKSPREPFRLINSKLKTADCIKIGANGLKYKKVRLFFTILLSAIALALFGLASTFTTFNVTQSLFSALNNTTATGVTISKTDFREDEYYTGFTHYLNNSDYEYISTTYGADIIKNMDISIRLPYADQDYTYSVSTYSHSMSFVSKSQIEKMGYNIISSDNSHWPSAVNECVVSELMYFWFQKLGYVYNDIDYKIEKIEDLIGKKIKIEENEYTISAVLDTNFDFENYMKVLEDRRIYSSEFQYKLDHGLDYAVILDSEYEDEFLARKPISRTTYRLCVNDGTIPNYESSHIYNNNNFPEDNIIKIKSGEYDKNDIIVNASYLDIFVYRYTGSYCVDCPDMANSKYCNSLEEARTIISDYLKKSTTPKYTAKFEDDRGQLVNNVTYNIAGVYINDDLPFYEKVIYFPTGIPTYLQNMEKPYKDFTIVGVTKLKDLVNDAFKFKEAGTRYLLINEYSQSLLSFGGILDMLSEIFIYISIGFAVFSSFLLMTFIATSISYKKQEIGILRALGAKKSDVYRIFLQESLIISLINLVVAIAMTIATIIVLNNTIATAAGIPIQPLSFGLIQGGLMLGLSLLVAVIATYLPVRKVAKMKPIDAIHNRK